MKIFSEIKTDNVQLYNLGKHLFGNNFLNVYSELVSSYNYPKILRIINVLLLILILNTEKEHIGFQSINIKIIYIGMIHLIDQ